MPRMSGSQDGTQPPPHPSAAVRAHTDRRWRLSWIWAIPLVTAAIGGWLAWDTLSKRGPLITITFQTAEGLQAGQSLVRHKDVQMGMVQSVALSADLQRVVVAVRMNREAEPLLTDKAQFWVVKPRFFAGSISGLETLLSGAYIELLPSSDGGTPKREFVGLEDPPVLQSDVPGHAFLLQAPRIGSINLGSPVFYRDLTVGEVLGWDIGDMADSVTIHAFVRAPYDRYVHDGSRFWNASGASITLGAKGVQLQLESIRALVLGGIAFDTPTEERNSPISAEGHQFPLFGTKEDADNAGFTERISFLSYFQASAAGLSVGAPVTLRGLRIGQVDSVQLEYNKSVDRVVVAVRYNVEPERVAQLREQLTGDVAGILRVLVHRGLRASLASSNLLTGQQEVALEEVPDAPPGELQVQGDIYVLPTSSAGFSDLIRTVGAVLAKVNSIPFEQIGNNLNETLRGASNLANSTQLQQAISSLKVTLDGVQNLVHQTGTDLDPVLKKLPALAQGLDEAVKRTNKLLSSADNGYGGDSKFNRDVDRMMLQLTDTARSIRVLADLLSRHPEALIRGRTDQGVE
jgi:paraquat-inducible protein B